MGLSDLTVLLALYMALAVSTGAFVHGFAGFGSSMVWVSSLALLLPPAQVVPTVLLFTVVASIGLLPAVWRDIDWTSLRWLLLGTAVATPVGVVALASLPADTIRMGIALIVLIATGLLWRGQTIATPSGTTSALTTGVGAGLLNGSTGIGGPPVILFYVGSEVGAAVSRASLIAYFLVSDVLGTAIMMVEGLLSTAVFVRTVLLLPLVGLGIWLGHRQFVRTTPETFRRIVRVLLACLALALLIRAVWNG